MAGVDGLTLPRSVTAALWLPHVNDYADAARAARAVTGTDEPHRVLLGRDSVTLADALARWAPVRAVAAALPAPGAPGAAPATVLADAVDAGECLVVVARRGSWAAVPQVSTFGSPIEPGAVVTWRATAVPDARDRLAADLGTLADARGHLLRAVATATATLAGLDLAQERPDAAARIAALDRAGPPRLPLPRLLDPARYAVVVQAARLLAIVAVAQEDDGAAVTSWQADQRDAALRDVVDAARHAMSTATLYLRR